MPTVTFTISAALAAELNEIAQQHDIANAKQMVRGYLRGLILQKRIRESSETIEPLVNKETDSGIQ